MKVLGILSLGLALGAFGCGSSTTENKSESMSYELELNGCSTGKHTFGSLRELCQGLKRGDLNRGCALSMRRQYFEAKNCASVGVIWENL
jgi:hypothetical protein